MTISLTTMYTKTLALALCSIFLIFDPVRGTHVQRQGEFDSPSDGPETNPVLASVNVSKPSSRSFVTGCVVLRAWVG